MGDLWATYGIDGEMIGRKEGGNRENTGKKEGEKISFILSLTYRIIAVPLHPKILVCGEYALRNRERGVKEWEDRHADAGREA
jgi:hypothetical protein